MLFIETISTCSISISLIFFFAFYAGPFYSVRVTLDGWRAEIIAEVEAENANDDFATDDCAIVRAPVNTALPSRWHPQAL